MSVLTTADRIDQSAIDTAMMQRCIRLSVTATEGGEFPFAAVICEGDMVVAEATNRVAQNGDVTQHAELVAVSKAQQVLGRKDLSTCTIYSNVEPCVMCSFPIRETRIARVVYAISSPIMGGFSRWNVLRDAEISNAMPEAFGPIPEVVAGLLQREAEKVWRKWNPIVRGIIKYRGCFGPAHDHCQHMRAIPPQLGFMRRLLMQYRNRHSI
jgi:tRNA(adenine34) deaminase